MCWSAADALLVYNLKRPMAIPNPLPPRRRVAACALLVALWAGFAGAASAFAQESEAAQAAATERADVARFRQRAEATIAANGAGRAYWGAVIVDADTGETL